MYVTVKGVKKWMEWTNNKNVYIIRNGIKTLGIY